MTEFERMVRDGMPAHVVDHPARVCQVCGHKFRAPRWVGCPACTNRARPKPVDGPPPPGASGSAASPPSPMPGGAVDELGAAFHAHPEGDDE